MGLFVRHSTQQSPNRIKSLIVNLSFFTPGSSSHLKDHMLYQDPLHCFGSTHFTWNTNYSLLLIFTTRKAFYEAGLRCQILESPTNFIGTLLCLLCPRGIEHYQPTRLSSGHDCDTICMTLGTIPKD